MVSHSVTSDFRFFSCSQWIAESAADITWEWAELCAHYDEGQVIISSTLTYLSHYELCNKYETTKQKVIFLKYLDRDLLQYITFCIEHVASSDEVLIWS